ncbi:MAG: cytidine deaminase [Candidatus Schekmanbacteria bacterium RIFCSPHIGHO2_02_FULL_38_11]|uniref:Cytidine deaminase n=1 Tax=Candidatus Schekmanbacteria bacterium RIFCSPLOWO2_12_FULL_38_15 TaxID=1817883 RepID=A0A1F7SNE1_9BACT|nr:MAG: cytidine deaminase [Candidatus Schekmanbacteria bacterium GWA2_38_9]OGL48814.1 MAG: cytidine deaminase [Candidatus Schekmanbacteria bacterium RIFCSPLOWO2_02_FULL_38_14]OGL52021.1 MAG: cytidine deaminase [Candidatus Schekmanbacteria bacterium RIFCSPHIGHO2_02_FULL_38_11]OGL55310.1 MAG: cytidine deaminase [Candidatus Schekmanbacteria bacterium RIFCSPLOWO2_12_FULL_38_15]
MNRPSWNEYFMEIALLVRKRSTCIRRQIGCVIVSDKKIMATGYNGAPSGLRHCLDMGCLREKMGIPSGQRHELCRALHAEQNAIIQAAISGINIKGSTIFCTHFPCSLCAKMLINVKASKIYYIEGYPDDLSKSLFYESNIPTEKIDIPIEEISREEI